MSSFWNRITSGNEEKPGAAGGGPKPAFGIEQANDLMSKLAFGDNAELIVRVIRKTLESVGVQVGDLIAEAKHREGELRTEIEQRRSKIGELERQIEGERIAISGLESDLALTGRTRDSLERSEGKGQPPALPPGSDESDRPTVMAVAKGSNEVVLSDADVVSILPDEPSSPPKVPKPHDTK
jgi:predicted RNase H-like nuclease (RuvC/YqgF family)